MSISNRNTIDVRKPDFAFPSRYFEVCISFVQTIVRTPYFLIDDKLGDGEDICRFVMQQGRITPIPAWQKDWTLAYPMDFNIDAFMTRLTKPRSFHFFIYIDATNSGFENPNVGKCAAGLGTHCC